MSATDPAIITPQVSLPSTFREHVEGGTGRTFPRTSTVKVPVYEQERFERRIYNVTLKNTGTGAAVVNFAFDPTLEEFPYSYRINKLIVANEPTADRVWRLIRGYTAPDGTAEYQICGRAMILANTFAPLVDGSIWAYSSTSRVAYFCSPPLDIYRPVQHPGGYLYGDQWQVISEANITNGDDVRVNATIEVIPHPASYGDASGFGTITP